MESPYTVYSISMNAFSLIPSKTAGKELNSYFKMKMKLSEFVPFPFKKEQNPGCRFSENMFIGFYDSSLSEFY